MARVALALTLALFALHSPAIQADSPDPIIHVGLTKNFANASRGAPDSVYNMYASPDSESVTL